ncbi:hypothetical protein V8C86DRAFT_3139841 [Haematococcus lacustris]
MSYVSPGVIESIAHSLDIPHLSSAAAKALAPDVEYRLRELIQDAQKFARHSRRTRLTTDDVNSALRLRNAEPLYGFGSKHPARFIRAAGEPDLYCVADPELPLEQVIDAPLPKPPIEVAVRPHWLFIEGVQPMTPENARLSKPISPAVPRRRKALGLDQASNAKRASSQAPSLSPPPGEAAAATAAGASPGPGAPAGAGSGSGAEVQPAVSHVLSRELQLYFAKVAKVVNAATAAAAAAVAGQVNPDQAAAGPRDSGQGAGGSRHWGAVLPPIPTPAAAGEEAVAAAAGGPQQGKGQEAGQGLAAVQAVEGQLRAVLASVATDPGLHPLCPYLVKLLADGVTASLACASALALLLRLADALLRNTALGLEHYLHQLLPCLLTCLVAKGLGSLESRRAPLPSGATDPWAVRDTAAQLVAQVCARFSDPYFNIQPRISKTLLRALLEPSKPLATHYGAIRGLGALGPASVRQLLLPQLGLYMERLGPLLPPFSGPSTPLRHPPSLPPPATSLDGQHSSADQGQAQAMEVDSDPGGGQPGPARAGALGGGGGGQEAGQRRGGSLAVASQRQAEALRVQGALVEVVAGALYSRVLEAAQPDVQRSDATLAAARRPLGAWPSPPVPSPAPFPLAENKGSKGAMAMDSEAAAGSTAGQGHEAAPADLDSANGVDGKLVAHKAATTALGNKPGQRSAAAVLAEAWREDSALAEVVWAVGEVLGPAFMARMPLAHAPHVSL